MPVRAGEGAALLGAGVLEPPTTFATTNTSTISTTNPTDTKAKVEGEKRRGGGAVICMLGRGARPLACPWDRRRWADDPCPLSGDGP